MVELEWLADQKGQGCQCALVPHPDWQVLHRHSAVWDPWPNLQLPVVIAMRGFPMQRTILPESLVKRNDLSW